MARRKKPLHTRKTGESPSPYDRIFGVHAVRAALANDRRDIVAIYATRNGLDRIADALVLRGVKPEEVTPEQLSKRLDSDTVHQGVLIETKPLPTLDLAEALARVSAASPLVVLDQVTDPHNVGAILRSAAAFNAAALVMTRRNSPPLEGTLAKAASGGLEHVPVVLVANLARALEEAGQAGITRIGLDGAADEPLEGIQAPGACAIVLGAEGKGVRRLTAERCDFLCRLSTTGSLRSLNVSNAAAVALHTLTVRPHE